MRVASLLGAALTLAMVFLPPFWSMAQLLFAYHMAQHLLLITLAAPLLVLAGLEIKLPPLSAWAVFVAVFLVWHWPTAFQWAARNWLTEIFELFSILLAAVGFWSVALGQNELGNSARALLVTTAAVATDLPGVVMLFAPTALCVMPNEDAARFGLTALEDQQIGGLLMWVPANLVFFSVATWLFARWIMQPSQPFVSPSGLR